MHISYLHFRVEKKCAECTFMHVLLSQIFGPLARLAIAKGWRFADVSECLRRAYVDAARAEAGKDASVSRLSVMTGLQRRDVGRLLETEALPQAAPDPLARLVGSWLALNDGEDLPWHGADGSFDALARSVRKDTHPRTFLDALVAAGTVSIEGDHVRLLKRAYVPLEGSEAQTRYLGQNVGDHLSVAVGNVLGREESGGYDLAVHYNALSAEAAEEIEALWRARMAPVLSEVNARAAELQQQRPGRARIRGGGYFRTEDAD